MYSFTLFHDNSFHSGDNYEICPSGFLLSNVVDKVKAHFLARLSIIQ